MSTQIARFARTGVVLLCIALCGAAAAQTASMETRLRSLEAESEIRRSLDDYMHLLRTRDWDLLAGAGRNTPPSARASKPAK